MALFQFKWLRRFVRRHTNPIPIDAAEAWKKRLSLLYMLIAWQAFGIVAYMVYTGRNDWAKYYGFKTDVDAQLTPAQHYAKMLNVEKGKIVRLSGFHMVGDAEFEKEKEDKTKNLK